MHRVAVHAEDGRGTSNCDGNPSCACTTGATCNSWRKCANGTDPFVRIKYFYTAGG